MKMNFGYFGHSLGGAPEERKAWLVCIGDSESKLAKLMVSWNRPELRRDCDRSLHRHVAIGRFIEFLPHPDLVFNRAQDSSRKIPEGADAD
jgi:hypothetical protein